MSGTYEGEGGSQDVLDITSLGTGLKRVRSEVIELNHSKAEELLNMSEFPGDRKLRNRHVDYLTDCMQRGTFVWDFVTLVTCRCAEDGQTYRMNGQHTCWARLNLPEKYRAPCRIIHYRGETEADVRRLYASIDRGSPRTKSNVIDSYLVGTEEFAFAKPSSLKLASRGISFWLWETKNERARHDGDDIAYMMMTDHYDLSCRVIRFLNKLRQKEHAHMWRMSVAAAMFATFKKSPETANDFWEAVATGIGFDRTNDPRLKLRNELMRSGVDLGLGARGNKKRVAAEEMYRWCIVAWNAYRSKRQLKQLKVPATRPKAK